MFLGVLLGFLVLEACLQLGAAYAVGRRRSSPIAVAGAARRIVCLGDSNTYGLWVKPANAYPRVLEELWNQRGGRRAEVINLGHSGNNSSAVRNRLLGILDEYHPDIVTVMVGANDMWTVSEPVADEPATLSYTIWRWSRVYRLLFIAWRAVIRTRPAGPVDAPFKFAQAKRLVPGWQDLLRRNLEAMAGLARTAGAEPVLLTFPTEFKVYGMANEVIRTTAAETGIHLIDVTPVFEARCPAWKCPELLGDMHPSAIGHALVAQTIAAALGIPKPLTN